MCTHGARRLLALILSLRYVARIQTSLNSCDRSQRQNSVAVTMIFTCRTRRFVAATCHRDLSQWFVASCVSALSTGSSTQLKCYFQDICLLGILRVHDGQLFKVRLCGKLSMTGSVAGLRSKSAWVLQATNFCLRATGKTYFFHISLRAGHPGFHFTSCNFP